MSGDVVGKYTDWKKVSIKKFTISSFLKKRNNYTTSTLINNYNISCLHIHVHMFAHVNYSCTINLIYMKFEHEKYLGLGATERGGVLSINYAMINLIKLLLSFPFLPSQ